MISFRDSFSIVLDNGSMPHEDGTPVEVFELKFQAMCHRNKLYMTLRKRGNGRTPKGDKRMDFNMPFDELCKVVDMLKSYNGIR